MFARRSIALLLLASFVVATCVALGLWQLRRLDEKQAIVALFQARSGAPPVEVTALAEVGADLRYRRVRATGRWLPEYEVAIVHRTRGGVPGSDIVTPLQLADQSVLLVRRGWVPIEQADPPIAAAHPPEGVVTVMGILLPSEERGAFGPPVPDTEREQFPRIDVARISLRMAQAPFPVEVWLATDPAIGEGLQPIAIVEPDEGPHRSYAFQWFAFAAIAIVTCVALLRRGTRPAASPEPNPRGPPPGG